MSHGIRVREPLAPRQYGFARTPGTPSCGRQTAGCQKPLVLQHPEHQILALPSPCGRGWVQSWPNTDPFKSPQRRAPTATPAAPAPAGRVAVGLVPLALQTVE